MRLIPLIPGIGIIAVLSPAAAPQLPPEPNLQPIVEVEESVYSYTPADNGAGPMWCSGSTCLVRSGNQIFASGLETIPNAKPLNNVRWLLFNRASDHWNLLLADPTGRTREPSPLAIFPDTRLFLSANPTLNAGTETYAGPAEPQILQFDLSDLQAPFQRLLPGWSGDPRFTEHSYRSFAADARNHELILFQNIDYAHAEWSFRDGTDTWSASGQLRWPVESRYDTPQPVRVCYPNIALQDHAVFFCGVTDIIEPNLEWRAFKKKLTGREWDYDFRRLFFTWSPDITRQDFRPWIEIASREATCGWISPGDLWVAPDHSVHLLWTERAIDERLRDRFFPDARQNHQLNYAVIRNGQVDLRRTLIEAREGEAGVIASAPRFHITASNRLYVVYYLSGIRADGTTVSENRLFEVRANGEPGPSTLIPFAEAFTSFFTATPRAGSRPSDTLDLLGTQTDRPNAIGYARVRLSGLFHKYGYVRGQGFFGQTRREQRAYPQRSVRREQRSLAEKERPPGGLRRIWPGAALLGRSSIAGDTLSPSRLASGQIGRNERDRIYETDH